MSLGDGVPEAAGFWISDLHELWVVAFVAVVLCSHFGLRLALYNRLNACGWPRRWIKRTEVVLLAETWLTPVVVAWWLSPTLVRWWRSDSLWPDLPVGWSAATLAQLAITGVLGVLWLIWRPVWKIQWAVAQRAETVVDLRKYVAGPLPRTRKCRAAARLPFNQMFDLATAEIELTVPGLPIELDGYRIAHLSDIHLTGQVDPAYAREVVRRAVVWQPDWIALTGDIVDKPIGLDWIESIFSQASAKDGCHFILGNHDTRVAEPDDVRRRMRWSGWTDLGGVCLSQTMRGLPVRLIGNEYPWFHRPSLATRPDRGRQHSFSICLSHSPDQFDWCRSHGVQLMLAGHTHGGQGRLPLAGPILSPSWHGSRWASGDFYRAPTTLHVSRGLGGVHLLRIRCRPELSLLTLRCP